MSEIALCIHSHFNSFKYFLFGIYVNKPENKKI